MLYNLAMMFLSVIGSIVIIAIGIRIIAYLERKWLETDED